MKTLLFLFLLASTELSAQTTKEIYIELEGSVTDMYTTTIRWANYPNNKVISIDTLVNYSKINSIIKTHMFQKPITIINLLAQEGWTFVSSVFVPGPELKGGVVFYYFKKIFTIQPVK